MLLSPLRKELVIRAPAEWPWRLLSPVTNSDWLHVEQLKQLA